MKKLVLSLVLIATAFSTQAEDNLLFKNVSEIETYFEVLGDLFEDASIPSIEELQDTVHPGRCFSKTIPNYPIAAGYMLRVAPKSDAGPLFNDKDIYQVSSFWSPRNSPNFYDEMTFEDLIDQFGSNYEFKRIKSLEEGITVDMNEKEVSILRKSGEYLIEEVRQGDEAHIRCYYFNTTL